ncbi:hypothetical protein ACOSQ4_018108 [Xanthoceras sorbifolium]
MNSVSWVNQSSMLDFLMACQYQLKRDEFLVFVVAFWAIWNRRNNIMHHRPYLPDGELLPWCRSFLEEFLQANATLVHHSPVSRGSAKWTPPAPNFFKLNSDSALDVSRNITGLGAVLRDSCGAVLLSCVDTISGLLPPIVAEAKAILLGLSVAIEGGFSFLLIKSDYAAVIQLLSESKLPISTVGLVINDIQDTLRLSSASVHFLHVSRKGNVVAHSLAKLAISINSFLVWVEDIPPIIGSLVELDSNFSV